MALGIAVSGFLLRERWGLACVRRAWPWAVCLAATLAVPSISRMKIIEFATAFDFLLIFAFARSVALLARAGGRLRTRRPVALPLTTACVIVSAATLRWTIPLWPAEPGEASHPTPGERAEVANRVFSSVERAARGQGSLVLVLGTRGIINHNLFEVWAVRDRIPLATSIARKPLSDAELASRLAGADILVANNGETGMTEPEQFPGLSGGLLRRVRSDQTWEEREVVAVPGTGGEFVVFARRAGAPTDRR
jgi:hypothetical protein